VANSDNLEVNGGDVTSFIRLGDANLDSNAVASSGLQHVDVIGDNYLSVCACGWCFGL